MTTDPAVAAALAQELDGGRLAHAYLFAGRDGTGKLATALHLACSLNCEAGNEPASDPCLDCTACRKVLSGNHPDIHRLVPEDELIRRDQVAELAHRLRLARAEGRYRMGILAAAELMNPEAANHLLKLLEEPPPRTVLVLLTAREFALLPTIRSRLRRVRFRGPAPRELAELLQREAGLNRERAATCAALAGGDPGLAGALAADEAVWELRDELLARLLELAGGDPYHAFRLAGELSTDGERDALNMRITLLAGLLRDVAVLAAVSSPGAGAPALINSERVEELERLAQAAAPVALLYALRSLLGLPRLFNANVNTLLAVEVALLRVQRSLQGSGARPTALSLPDPLHGGPQL